MDIKTIVAVTSPLRVSQERCIHAFSQCASCKKCVQFCPKNCIHIENGCISVEGCDGCGRCIQACPHDVFEMDFGDALKMPENKPLIIACHKHDFSDMPIFSANCLQQFTWLELAILVRRFGQVVLYADEKNCDECDCDWFPQGQKILMERYGLKAYADKLRIIREAEEMRKFLDVSFSECNARREYMKNKLTQAKAVTKKYAQQSVNAYLDAFHETVRAKQALTFVKTQSQAMLLHELYRGKEEIALEQEIPLQALVSSCCRFCRICEQLCPWQAIAIVENDGNAMLVHHDVLCSRCGLCLDICPEHGLHWDRGLTVADIAEPHWRILANGSVCKCERCGEDFYPTKNGQTLCAICRNKRF